MSHFRPTKSVSVPLAARWARPALAMAISAVLLAAGPGHAQDAEPQTQPERQSTQPGGSTLPTTLPSTSPAPARNGPDGQNVQRQNGGLVLNFQDANIDVVLDELSEAAGLIIVREVEPEGRVTLTSRQPVSAEDAVQLLSTVLHNNGYAAIRQGRILKIVESSRAKKLNIPVRSGADPNDIPQTDELITQVIPLRHADATQLRQDLQPLINPEADFTANASSNALVITDTSANVRRIVEVIAALDTSLADSVDVRVFQLEFADATNAANLINEVFGQLQVGPGAGGDPREMMMQMMQRRGRGGDDDRNGGGARGSRVNAAADQRTNSVVVTGPGDTLDIVSTVIAQLDENPVADETVFVYHLRNAQAANIEMVVNNLFGNVTGGFRGAMTMQQNPLQSLRSSRTGGSRGGGLGGGGGGLGGGGRFGGGGGGGAMQRQQQLMMMQQQQMQQQQQRGRGGGGGGRNRVSRQAQEAAAGLAGQVTIIADVDTNSLLVRTSPQNYEQVRAILEELDRPVAQVLIKVLIAEVTHDDSIDLGAEFSVLNLRASGNGQEGSSNFNIPVEGAGATGLVVQIMEEDFTAAVRALETAGKLDVLSRPYILASDNQVASITVGQEVPFVTNSRITDEGGIINTIDYADIGILLDVIPHINPDGLVILDVAPEISTLTSTTVPISELVNAPVIAKRSALSRVGVKSGQTIVIGGLMEDRKTSTVAKVPILGDIPLIGNAFRRTQQTKVKTELLIFLTPHVATDPDLLEDMADQELDGTQLVPNAVSPGTFRDHMEGLQRGDVGGADNYDAPPDRRLDPNPSATQPGSGRGDNMPGVVNPGFQPANTEPTTRPVGQRRGSP